MEAVPVVRPESRRVRTASLPSGQQLARQLVTTVRVAEVLLRQAIVLPTGISGRSHRTGRRGRRAARGVGNLRGLADRQSVRVDGQPGRASTIAIRSRSRSGSICPSRTTRGRAAREHLRPPPRQRVRRDAVGRGGAVGLATHRARRAGTPARACRHARALVDTVAANVNAALGAAGFGATR